jgi:hypothetical protein
MLKLFDAQAEQQYVLQVLTCHVCEANDNPVVLFGEVAGDTTAFESS